MRKNKLRYLAFCLALTLIFSFGAILSVGAAASREYFVFEALVDAQAQRYPAADTPIILSLGEGAEFSAEGLSLLSGDTNSLYVSLVNHSNATKIRVSYTYELYGVSADEVTEQAILPQSTQKQTILLDAPHIGADYNVSALTLSFLGDGALSGDVELKAMFNHSSYVQEGEREASFSHCAYNAQSGEIEIQGSLSYAATVRYEGETLALFALSEGEDLHLSGKIPVARTSISFNFSFRFEAQNSDELFARYVVAAITAKGERIPLCVPTYPSFATTEIPREQGFQGVAGAGLGDMIDVAPDVGVVDVHLNRLLSTQSGGVLYAGEYDYYYFDPVYLAELDRQIENLVGIGAHVYLRLLIDGEGAGLSFADEGAQGVQNRVPVIRTKQARRDLFALVDFLSARYAKENALSGLILGRAADLISTHSYCAASGLAEYTALYAATLHLVASVARTNVPSLQVLLPVSDRIFDESITALQERGCYTELFLPSLLKALEEQNLSPQTFAVMLESEALCDLLAGKNESEWGTDRLTVFLRELQAIAVNSPYVQGDIFFSWLAPSNVAQTTLRADYLLKYAVLFQNASVGAFFLDLGQNAGRSDVLAALVHMAKYINTDRYDDFCATALTSMGLSGINELYPSLQGTSFRQRRTASLSLATDGYLGGAKITGSYVFWDFSRATDTLDWYAGNACSSLSALVGENGAHTLSGVCHADGEYADVSYHFTAPSDLSFAPLWKAELAVIGEPGTRYELQIRLIGDQSIATASAIVTAGEEQTLYLDLSQSTHALTHLRNVRILARPLDVQGADFELCVSKITLESASLSYAELSQRVDKIRENIVQSDTTPDTQKDYSVQLLITGVIAFVSIAISVAFIASYRIKRRWRNVIRKDNYKE